jgi:hypothetical protein
MSQENVEIGMRANAAFNSGNVDAALELFAPDAEQGRGRASGMSIDIRQFDLYEFRDGMVIRATLGLRSKQEALEAAGVRE